MYQSILKQKKSQSEQMVGTEGKKGEAEEEIKYFPNTLTYNKLDM